MTYVSKHGRIATAVSERAPQQSDAAIGRPRQDLATPGLVLSFDAAQRNIGPMAAPVRESPAEIRPQVNLPVGLPVRGVLDQPRVTGGVR